MATPGTSRPTPKRKSDAADPSSLVGYLHKLSEVKRSKNNNLYFDALLQTSKDERRRMVSFSAEKYSKFQTAATLHSPVKLTNITLSPNRGEIEVLFNKWSTLECVNASGVPFKKRLFKEEDNICSKLKNLLIPRQTVSVQVKVLQTLEEQSTEDVYGKTLQKMEILVADDTLEMPLTIWGNHIAKIENGKSYNLKYLSTRDYRNNIKLTTTPRSEIEEIHNIPVTDAHFQREKLEEITCPLEFVSTYLSVKCGACGKAIEDHLIGQGDEDGDLTECPHCSMTQTNRKLKTSILAHINIESPHGQKKLTAFESVIKAFLEETNNVGILHTAKDVTKFLMSHPQVHMKFSKDLILTKITLNLPEQNANMPEDNID